MLNKKRVFIIQNTELNANLPLSVYLTNLLSHFDMEDVELNLIVSKSENIPEKIRKKCNKIFELSTSLYKIKDNIKFSILTFKILSRENTHKKIDIVHCFYPNSSLLGAVLFKKIISSNVKLIYDVRSPWIEMIFARKHVTSFLKVALSSILNLEEKILIKYVDHVIFISAGLKAIYQRDYRYFRASTIISSGVDTMRFKPISSIRHKINYNADDVVIGYVGTLCKSRELMNFLTFFHVANKKNRKLRLFLLGEGSEKSLLEKEVLSLKLSDSVQFHSPVPHDQVPKYICSFDFGLCHLPNKFVYENSFPLKILEYVACGIPVLASTMNAHKAIAKKIEGVNLYDSAEDLLRIIESKRVKPSDVKNYDWRKIAEKYKNIYSSLEKAKLKGTFVVLKNVATGGSST